MVKLNEDPSTIGDFEIDPPTLHALIDTPISLSWMDGSVNMSSSISYWSCYDPLFFNWKAGRAVKHNKIAIKNIGIPV